MGSIYYSIQQIQVPCMNGMVSNSLHTHYINTCFGVRADSSDLVCSGKGNCQAVDQCLCDFGYEGKNCNVTSCYGIMSNNSNDCSGRGSCNTKAVCKCSNTDHLVSVRFSI